MRFGWFICVSLDGIWEPRERLGTYMRRVGTDVPTD